MLTTWTNMSVGPIITFQSPAIPSFVPPESRSLIRFRNLPDPHPKGPGGDAAFECSACANAYEMRMRCRRAFAPPWL